MLSSRSLIAGLIPLAVTLAIAPSAFAGDGYRSVGRNPGASAVRTVRGQSPSEAPLPTTVNPNAPAINQVSYSGHSYAQPSPVCSRCGCMACMCSSLYSDSPMSRFKSFLKDHTRRFRKRNYYASQTIKKESAFETCPPYYQPNYGYHATCWRRMADDCLNCPPVEPLPVPTAPQRAPIPQAPPLHDGNILPPAPAADEAPPALESYLLPERGAATIQRR